MSKSTSRRAVLAGIGALPDSVVELLALPGSVVALIARHKAAEAAHLAAIRKEDSFTEEGSKVPDAVKAETAEASYSERNALLDVIEFVTTLPELIIGLEYLKELVVADDCIMIDWGEQLLDALIAAAENIAAPEAQAVQS